MSLNQPSGCQGTSLAGSANCASSALACEKLQGRCGALPPDDRNGVHSGSASMLAALMACAVPTGGYSSQPDGGAPVGLDRDRLDADVLAAMRKLRSPKSAGQVADKVGASLMATVYSLRRLARAGRVEMHTEIIDTPSRTGSTIVMYVLRRQPKSRWPAWLAPTELPPTLSSRRIERP